MSEVFRPVIITALPVAFGRDGSLSLEGTRQIFRKAASSGVDGVLPLGTTGEFVSLDDQERGALVDLAVQEFAGMRCIVHVGAASSYQVARLIGQARDAGVTELAVLTPYYLPTTDAAMLRFFTEAAEAAAGIPLHIYVFRARSGNMVSTELMRDIAAVPGIVGAKVSGEAPERLREYRAVVPDSFALYTGGDDVVARVDEYGAQGVVSGNASALPGPFTRIASLVAGGAGADEIAEAQRAVDDVVTVLAGDMARLKAALRLQGVDAGYPRMAIEEPDEATMREIARVVQAYADVPAR